MRVNDERQNMSAIKGESEAPAAAENDLSISDDLFPTAETEADVKAGCLGCSWGPPVLNHNETTAEDDTPTEALEDLAVEDAAQVKGGTPNGRQLVVTIKDGPAAG